MMDSQPLGEKEKKRQWEKGRNKEEAKKPVCAKPSSPVTSMKKMIEEGKRSVARS